MERFLEFVANHSILWSIFAALLISWALLEWKLRGRAGFELSSFDFTRKLNAGGALLIDLRPTADFDRGHIRGAKHLTPSQVDPGAKDIAKAKESPVLLYCQSGVQSVEVAEKLRKAGFAQVYSLKGGVAQWLQDQMPLEKGKGR